MPLEFSSRAAWSSSCSRRDFAAVSRRADAALLLTSRIALIFYGAALRLGFGFLYGPSGHQVVQRGFHVFVSRRVVRENLIVHGAFICKLAVAIDQEKARRGLAPLAGRVLPADMDKEG